MDLFSSNNTDEDAGGSSTTSLSFANYESTTINPGWPLIVGVFFFSLIVNLGIKLWMRCIKGMGNYLTSLTPSISSFSFIKPQTLNKKMDQRSITQSTSSSLSSTACHSNFLSQPVPSNEGFETFSDNGEDVPPSMSHNSSTSSSLKMEESKIEEDEDRESSIRHDIQGFKQFPNNECDSLWEENRRQMLLETSYTHSNRHSYDFSVDEYVNQTDAKLDCSSLPPSREERYVVHAALAYSKRRQRQQQIQQAQQCTRKKEARHNNPPIEPEPSSSSSSEVSSSQSHWSQLHCSSSSSSCHSLSSEMTKSLKNICTYDDEMKSLCSLSLPYTMSGFIEGMTELIIVSIIGHWLGTVQANAYVMCVILTEITSTINYGFAEALGTIGPQAKGAGNDTVVGQYLQLSIIFYVLGSIPVTIFWTLFMKEAVLWFGFDEETAFIAQLYAIPYNLSRMIGGIDDCLQELLNFSGHEYYSLICGMIQCLIHLVVVLGLTNDGSPINIEDMAVIGYIQFSAEVLYVACNVMICIDKGWLDCYWDGFVDFGTIKNGKVVRNLIHTAIPLSVSWIVTYGEWEIITLFVSFMGPAEVAAWGLLGYLWEVSEYITEAISDACEVRVGYHLGDGRPEKAKLVGYKGIALAFISSTMVAVFIWSFGSYISDLITPDPTLQRMIHVVLPLLGVSQIGLATATVCWAVIGAQGRYTLATTITFVGSWLVTIPISIITIVVFNWNLLGPVSSLVIGYTISGAILIGCFLSSDWKSLSALVVERHQGIERDIEPSGCKYDNYDWKELPKDAKIAAKVLGYRRSTWDHDGATTTSDKYWTELNAKERKAAEALGYNQDRWDRDDTV